VAGLGFKDFQVGEVLTSSDVDGYLMAQAVMRFADSGARGSALGTATGTAVALAEGMVSYLDDTDVLEVYTGSDWKRVAGLLQVVTATDSTDRSTGSTTFVTANISVTITPKRDDSDILVLWSAYLQSSGGTTEFVGANVRITDGTNPLVGAEVSGFNSKRGSVSNSFHAHSGPIAVGWYDVTSTSPVTFAGEFLAQSGKTTLLYNSTYQAGRLIAIEVAP